MISLVPLLRAALLAVAIIGGPAAAHEGHDHAEEAKAPLTASVSPRLEAASALFELVAVLGDGELQIYLDRFDTNAPVAGATIAIETPKGPIEATARGGTYRISAQWAKPGSYDLIFTVTAENVADVLAGTLVVPNPAALAPQSGKWSPLSPAALDGFTRTLGKGGVALLVVAAFVAGWLAGRFVRRNGGAPLIPILLASALLAAPGPAEAHDGREDAAQTATARRDVAERLLDGTLFVPKPVQRILDIHTAVTRLATHRKVVELPGRIIPDPNASGFVQASVSGRLSAPEKGFPRLGTAVKAGDVLAFVAPPFQAIDVSDMRQKAGELDQQISIVEKRIARYEPLASTGAVAKVTLDEAILELKGLKERRAALDRVRGESERLVAPVSGIVASANAVSGQIAEINAVVFQIVDPARLWVEALTFNPLPDARSATARTGDGRTLKLAFQGSGLTDRSQAIPVHFAVESDTRGLRVGQLVTVLAATGEEAHGLAVPRTSILRAANGQTILFEHTTAERFEPRIVRVEPLDAERLLVLEGLQAGKRVVVQGAELLNQIR